MKIASRIVIAPNVDTIHIQLFDNSEIFRHRKGSYHGQGSLNSMQTRKETVSLREKRDIQKFTKKREKSSNARTPGAKHHHHHRSWIQRLLVWVPPGLTILVSKKAAKKVKIKEKKVCSFGLSTLVLYLCFYTSHVLPISAFLRLPVSLLTYYSPIYISECVKYGYVHNQT